MMNPVNTPTHTPKSANAIYPLGALLVILAAAGCGSKSHDSNNSTQSAVSKDLFIQNCQKPEPTQIIPFKEYTGAANTLAANQFYSQQIFAAKEYYYESGRAGYPQCRKVVDTGDEIVVYSTFDPVSGLARYDIIKYNKAHQAQYAQAQSQYQSAPSQQITASAFNQAAQNAIWTLDAYVPSDEDDNKLVLHTQNLSYLKSSADNKDVYQYLEHQLWGDSMPFTQSQTIYPYTIQNGKKVYEPITKLNVVYGFKDGVIYTQNQAEFDFNAKKTATYYKLK